ncbi:RNA polymerase sigma factor [Microbulbifer hydrolyticus]|uniref:RNA polymerase sigma-70 factor (ECF subfamily) n=1 Tax=Microbulbifer hydrolyticus TaxID=48074 RepID=A0A6P1T4R4_9GAMM|nr:RNA polymerase sigma factor [Microbulbifer hydrolyticus]MBB5211381.1 RNA polymerase sigma-70 factor (ECF subfamily) [Microbulbifer hydrolyticus]QHQ37864.1 sigma-70 family RNA polymerase sigma factor [Microbulbifer hydrolyticus]
MSLIEFFRGRAAKEDRFTALVRPHLRLMHRMAYRWTQDRADAEDLVQDVLTHLFSRTDELDAVEKLGPWLVKVLYRRYVDLFRRRANSPIDETAVCISDDAFFQERLEDGRNRYQQLELQRLLNNALFTLDASWRDVVLLHDVEGYTALEVAEILDINVGTVKSRLHRARKKLRSVLEPGTVEAFAAC